MRYATVIIFITLSFTFCSTAGKKSAAARSPYDQRPDAISLNGEWLFAAVEPLIDLVQDRSGSFDPPDLSTGTAELFPQALRRNPEPHLPAEDEWKTIQVPAAWELLQGIDFNGAGWYRRTFRLPEEWAGYKRLFLEFDAAATAAGVWINRVWVGGQVSDYRRWRLEIGDAVNGAENELLVYLDELPGHIMQGFLSVVAPHHGGIWQEVRLIGSGPVLVAPDGIRVVTDADSGDIEVKIRLDGPFDLDGYRMKTVLRRLGSPADITVQDPWRAKSYAELVFDYSYDQSEKLLTASARLPDASRWSPDRPVMYELEFSLLDKTETGRPLDHRLQRFAFRTIEIRGADLLLNGKPFKLRSILNWGYYPGLVAPMPTLAEVRREFQTIKSFGFNAETLCLVVLPDYFYDLADEMGLLLWQEYPTWHNVFTEKELPTYKSVFPSFFQRDSNHPSIVLRSISVEAGVKDQAVMGEMVQLARTMTDTPVQDNSSWFWLSNLEISDWYGEDNYWNNNRWSAHMLINLPEQLDHLPEKPYIIGESVAATSWIDSQRYESSKTVDEALLLDSRPYWFPASYSSCLEVEAKLRTRYNPLLPDGEDIVDHYLLPQSLTYSLEFRRFQLQLLKADPRYSGWTLFLLRDLPQIRSGLIDDFGRPKWRAHEWDWLKSAPDPAVGSVPVERRRLGLAPWQLVPKLLGWESRWNDEIRRDFPLAYLKQGYSDLADLFSGWPAALGISENELDNSDLGKGPPIVFTTVLSRRLLVYLQHGGTLFLLTSKWPGGLDSRDFMFWSGAFFAPPVGPWRGLDLQRLIKLHQYDLNIRSSQAIPVGNLGIQDGVDPLIRFYHLHDQKRASAHDQLFATRVGRGLLVASSLDHKSDAGQWILSRLIAWFSENRGIKDGFPRTRLPLETLNKQAVEAINTIISIDSNWRFRLDPGGTGESRKWMTADYSDRDWSLIQAGRNWESQGYRYDGMAWYRRWIEMPETSTNERVVLVCEGVDDAYNLWLNGQYVTRHGSFSDHSKTVFVTRTETDISDFLQPGRNLIVMQVVDLTGGGGINNSIYLKVTGDG